MKPPSIIKLLLAAAALACPGGTLAQSTGVNHILTSTLLDSTGTPSLDQIDYFDGLGRPVQTLIKKASQRQLDIVTTREYDPTKFTLSAFYHDHRGRVVQTRSTNHLGGHELEYMEYTFTGKVKRRRTVHSAPGKTTQTETYAYDYGARHYDAATGRWFTADPLAEKYYPTSPYVYCGNNPVKNIDPTGMYIESAWDVISLVTGAKSFVDNIKQGNVGGAIIDGVGVVADAATLVIPGVPGGAGAGIKVIRAGNKAIDAVQAGKAASKLDKVDKTVKAIGPAGDAGGQVMKQLPEAMQSNARTTKGGTVFKDPLNPKGNNVRVQSGNPKSPNQSQQSPYEKETRNGKVIDKDGNVTKPTSPNSHIPKDDYKYKR